MQDPEPKDSAVSRRQNQPHLPNLAESLAQPRGRAGNGHERGGKGACSHFHTSSHSSSLMSTGNLQKVKVREKIQSKGERRRRVGLSLIWFLYIEREPIAVTT